MRQQTFNIDGCLTYWSLGATNKARLEGELEQLQFDRCTPASRTKAAALKEAMRDYCKSQNDEHDVKIEGHKQQQQNGFEAVVVDRGEDQNYYTHSFSAKMDENDNIVVSKGYADKYQLRTLVDKHKAILPGASIGKFLVNVVQLLGGTCLKESGGVYWLPERSTEEWQAVARAVERSAVKKSEITTAVVPITPNLARNVKSAIVREVITAAAKISEEIGNGLGARAAENRKLVIDELHNKITEYESVIGETLDGLRSALKAVAQSAAFNTMDMMADTLGTIPGTPATI